jgi:hypothetical protein
MINISLTSVHEGNKHGWCTADIYFQRVVRPIGYLYLPWLPRTFPEDLIKFAFEQGHIEVAMLAKQALYK